MIICVDNYHEDITYKGIRTYLHYGRIGLCHLESGRKIIPSFHCVVITDKYVFVEADGCWGIIDLYLSLIDPKTPDEIGYMMDAMREIYEDKLKTISEQSLQDWQDGEIDDINKLPLVMKVVNGRREVQNIPHVIADWIGLIAYTRKKYSV